VRYRKSGESGNHIDAPGAGNKLHRLFDAVGIDVGDGPTQVFPIVA
jgi:hypothetical protein